MAGKTIQYMLAMRAFPDNWASLPSTPLLVAAAADQIAPKAPSDLTALAIPEGIVLTWTYPTLNADESICNDLASIYIYRSGAAGIDIDNPATYTKRFQVSGETFRYDALAAYGDGRFWRCVLNATGSAEATTVADRGYRGRQATLQYFVVTAVDTTGNQSVASDEVNQTPSGSSSYTAEMIKWAIVLG